MVEGRVHTHGTLSAVRKRGERSARSQSSCQVRQAGPLNSELSRGRPVTSESCLGVERRPYCPPVGPPPCPPLV